MEDPVIVQKYRYLQAADLFRGVGSGVLKDLARQSVFKTIHEGETIFEIGDDGDAMYLILSGAVLVEQPFETGNLGFAVRRGPGEAVGEMALLDETPRMATVRATEESRMLVIHRKVFQDALNQSPDLAAAMIGCLAARLRAAWDRIRILQTANLQFRIIQKLVEIADQQQREGHHYPLSIRLKQSDLAEMTGSNLYDCSRQIRPLREANLLQTGRGHILILNLDGLRSLLEYDVLPFPRARSKH